MNSQVVLKVCTTDELQSHMISQDWEQKSAAAILGADIAPKGLQVMRAELSVTVTLLAAMPKLAKKSDPYTFAVTARFRTGAETSSNTASATLHINYVRF